MTFTIDRNRNTSDEADVKTTITVDDTTAVVLAAANPNRTFFEVNITPSASNLDLFVSLYPASDDNIKRGSWVGRFSMGNNVAFKSEWRMSEDNIYTGEISAILTTSNQDEDVFVVEY